jgi:hypothetical protein
MSQEKIEFYKNRTIGERFAAAGDFIRQNWKVLLKNIVYIGVPLVLIQGYLVQSQVHNALTNIGNPNPFASYSSIPNVFANLIQGIISLFLISMTGSILREYTKGSLTEDTGWSDLKDNMLSFAGKIFLQGLILVPGIIVLVVVVALLASFTGIGIGNFILFGVVMLVFVGFLFVILPPLSLINFPVFFEDASAWEGIKKGFRLGFKYWGSIVLTLLLGGLLFIIVYYIFLMPYIVYTMLHLGEGLLGYVLAMFSSLIMMVMYPVFIIFMGLQYTSIVEREEGVSLQDKVAEFDNL